MLDPETFDAAIRTKPYQAVIDIRVIVFSAEYRLNPKGQRSWSVCWRLANLQTLMRHVPVWQYHFLARSSDDLEVLRQAELGFGFPTLSRMDAPLSPDRAKELVEYSDLVSIDAPLLNRLQATPKLVGNLPEKALVSAVEYFAVAGTPLNQETLTKYLDLLNVGRA